MFLNAIYFLHRLIRNSQVLFSYAISPSPTPTQELLLQKTQSSALRDTVQAVQKWHVVLPPSAGSRRDGPGLESRTAAKGFWDAFQNTSLLFWPREQEIGQLKQDVVNLKSTIAKEEERAADLKHRVQVFSSEEHNTDVQVLLEIKARWDSMAMSSSSPLTITILGKKWQRAGISAFLSSGAAARAGLGHSAGSKLGQTCPHHAAAVRGEENPQRHPGCCNLALATAKLGWGGQHKNSSIQPSHPRHCKANWEANNWVLLRKLKSTGFLFYSFEGMWCFYWAEAHWCISPYLLLSLGQNAHKLEQKGAGGLQPVHWRQWGKPDDSADAGSDRKTAQQFTGQPGESPTRKDSTDWESQRKRKEDKVKQDSLETGPLFLNIEGQKQNHWKS